MGMTAQELCHLLDGELEGDPAVSVTKPGKIEDAEPGSLSFLANPKYEQYAYDTKASILLVPRDFKPQKPMQATLIRVSDVYQSLGLLLSTINREEVLEEEISPLANVHPTATLGTGVRIGAFAVICAGATIGNDSFIYPQAYVGQDVKIGSRVKIFPGTRIFRRCEIGDRVVIHSNSVIGSDGFGFARGGNGEYSKIAQVGNVVLESDVEIGSNTTIDRATMGSTVIKKGAKLDNLIQIAHNVEVGQNTAIAAQAGIAGSTKIGNHVLVGGQAGFVGHITVADGTSIQAQSGVAASITEPKSRVYGSPALSYLGFLKAYNIFRKLPSLLRRLEQIERRLENDNDHNH